MSGEATAPSARADGVPVPGAVGESSFPHDVVVVGAGPAGALAALLLARQNRKVLLVDRAPAWPRDKPCGGCLDPQALQLLKLHGLARLLGDTYPITRTSFHHRSQTIAAPIAHAVALPRATLDATLVQAFQQAGGTFLPATSATVPSIDRDSSGMGGTPLRRDATRPITLTHNGITRTLQSQLLLIADGLSGTALSHHPWAEWHVAPNAHLGVAANLPDHPRLADPNTIHMHVAPEGYVGLVRLPAGLHLGAALSPTACRAQGGPAEVIRRILRSSANLALPDDLTLKGTPLLTRHRKRLGSHRLLTLGDACAYVEPFTGQGIGWALRSAHEAVDLLAHHGALARWPRNFHHLWTARYGNTISPQHRPCQAIRAVLRNEALTTLAGSLIDFVPELPGRLTAPRPALHDRALPPAGF